MLKWSDKNRKPLISLMLTIVFSHFVRMPAMCRQSQYLQNEKSDVQCIGAWRDGSPSALLVAGSLFISGFLQQASLWLAFKFVFFFFSGTQRPRRKPRS